MRDYLKLLASHLENGGTTEYAVSGDSETRFAPEEDKGDFVLVAARRHAAALER